LNYSHSFHAGNFADVFKHALLTRLVLALQRKDSALRLLDTHAGEGLYDLAGEASGRTGEWRDGIGRFSNAKLSSESARLLAPYLDAVGPLDAAGRPSLYPGSPILAQTLLRPQDRMIFCELHPKAHRALAENLGRDKRAKAILIDGYTGLKAYLPPVERRGLVLIDPPFEARDEFARMGEAVLTAWRKWRTGVYALWHPVKDARAATALGESMVAAGVANVLRLHLQVREPRPDSPLAATGLLVLNAPFGFEDEARALLPELAGLLAQGPGAEARIESLARS
jgi:23S rRNA (adenine2030-N6)-methyltransferase